MEFPALIDVTAYTLYQIRMSWGTVCECVCVRAWQSNGTEVEKKDEEEMERTLL
jgi:hypothetical protein